MTEKSCRGCKNLCLLDEAYCMWQLAKAAYEAAQSADEARGEPNGH
jgi:hypothetical protein